MNSEDYCFGDCDTCADSDCPLWAIDDEDWGDDESFEDPGQEDDAEQDEMTP